MIQAIINRKYIEYADVLFSFFEGFTEGQGCYLMRILRNKYNRFDQREYLDYLYKILYNLCVNGYFSPTDTRDPLEGFITLTEMGADYIHGGSLIVNKVNFSQYISFSDSDLVQFEDLWSLIGEKDKAPFYISGPLYLNMIRPYLTEYVESYTVFLTDRKEKSISTSRRIWYKELYLSLNQKGKEDFLTDLSYAVSLSYFYSENNDEEYEELLKRQLADIGEELAREVPELPQLKIATDNKKQSAEELLAISLEICNAYKSLIEYNRMYRLLYNDDDSPKDETAAQLLFYSVADGYCNNYDVDLNRENDPGIGELDFKLSVGKASKVVIEMKLSSNSNLLHGFEKQLPAYLRAEETKYGVYLILMMNKTPEPQLRKVLELFDSVKENQDNTLRLICIDATPKPSASKL